MAGDLDVVGTAAVDVIPIAPNFHDRLKAMVLPAADRVGEDVGRRLGDAISRNIVVSIPDAITDGGRRARVSATREGAQVGGAFGRSIKAKLEEAFRSLPRADVRLGDTGLNADLDRLRARIQSLSGKTVGIDIDAGAALAEITDINARLERLAAEHPSVQVRTDTAAARAALAAVQAQINDVDRDDVKIRVKADTAGAIAALRALGISLGVVAAIPVVPVAAAGIGSITAAALAAGAGVGALALAAVPAIKGVTAAIQAKTAAEKQSATATDNSAASSVKAAQNALQLSGAQASLASAHRQAAQAVAQANEQVENAERSLTDAKRSARQAELDLTQARADAAQQLKALNDQLRDGILSQRDAELRVKEAKADLDKTLADPKADDLQRQRAQLSYDQAVQALKEQKEKNADLKKSRDEATKGGVDGSKQVTQAQENLRQANERVADQERAVADARRKVREAEVQGAEAVASAERSLQAARLSGVDTTSKAATKADAYREALDKLTPSQRELYDALAGPKGLTPAFTAWSTSLQPAVLPLFTRGVNAAKGALPGLSPLVRTAADAVGILFDKASRELKRPFWRDFKRDIDTSAKPAIVGFGVTFGNVIKGAAGVVDAFLPHIDSIADRMVRSSGRFATWGTKLKGSPEFERFLKYADDKGPLIAQTIGSIAGAILSVGTALSPISGPLLRVIGSVADGLASVADTLPWLVQLIYGAWAATKLWTIAMAALTLVMEANPIVLIVSALVALVAGIVYAYKHFDGFRALVDTVWAAIKIGTLFLWEKVLRPTFGAIWWALKGVGDIAVWLWKNAISPAFDGILLVGKILAAVLITLVIAPIVIAVQALGTWIGWLWTYVFRPTFKLIGGLAVWLWKNALAPAVQGIADLAKWLYEKGLRPFFRGFWDQIQSTGKRFKGLYDDYVSPVFGDIADIAKWLYDKGLKPVFGNIRSAVGLVADAFDDARAAIKLAWYKVAGIAAKPVNFIVDMVYTHGIKAVWDKVAGFVGLDKLPKAPKLLDETPKFANGGRTYGGIPGKDSIPILAMADEYIIKRSSARKIGFGTLEYMNRTGELPRFAGGGIVGDVWNWTKDTVGGAVSKGIDWTKTGADLLLHPGKIWDKLVKPVLASATKHLDAAPMGRMLAQIPFKAVKGLKDMLVDAVTGGGSADVSGLGDLGAHGASAKQAQDIARRMLPAFGWGPEQMAPLIKLWNGESGWRWNALNASSGAYGIPQALPAGKMASAGADWRTNAATQIKWGLGYIKHRPDYGSPAAAWSKWMSRSPHWYDQGGYLPPGLSLVANGTGRPEPVMTSQQWDDIRAAKSGGRPNIQVDVDVHTTLDGRELRGVVVEEINIWDKEMADSLNNGRIV